MKRLFVLVCLLGMSASAFASDFTVGQRNKKFTEHDMTVSVGDTVYFRNDDPFSHNVYSLSEAKSFDLGSYPKGSSRAVTFDQPGEIEVGCAIHFDMMMTIHVK